MKHIVIFASGSGSNAEKIIQYFRNHKSIRVVLVVSNNPNAKVLDKADKNNILSVVIQNFEDKSFIKKLHHFNTNLIVLAGFLKLIPKILINSFNIINLHPALLPKYGGKGMYGENVHKAVLNANEKESGITIHKVNEFYDEGKILLQAKCKIDDDETVQTLQKKIHKLEYKNYAKIIENILLN